MGIMRVEIASFVQSPSKKKKRAQRSPRNDCVTPEKRTLPHKREAESGDKRYRGDKRKRIGQEAENKGKGPMDSTDIPMASVLDVPLVKLPEVMETLRLALDNDDQ